MRPTEHELRVLVYFDEAHCLTEPEVYVINNQNEDRSAYMALCSALSDLQEFDLMGLFLSTSSRLAKFALPKAAFWSARGLETQDLQCPFVELPFREIKKEIVFEGSKNTNLNSFCSIDNLVRLSRPL